MLGCGAGTGGYDLGVSGRVGIVFTNRVSLTLDLTYHRAETLPLTVDTAHPATEHFSAALFYFGPELGYSFRLREFVIRPYLAIAAGYLATSDLDPAATSFGPATWLGLQASWDIPRTPIFVGVDVRAEGMAVAIPTPYVLGSVSAFGSLGVWFGAPVAATGGRSPPATRSAPPSATPAEPNEAPSPWRREPIRRRWPQPA
jgi:hypothetical protein